MVAHRATVRPCDAVLHYRSQQGLRRMTSATRVTLRTRNQMDATSHHAASVTIRRRTRELQPMPLRFVSLSVTRSTAGVSVWVALIVITTRPACHKKDKSARLALWNTSPPETTPVRLVIMGDDPSEVIWISRIASGVTPDNRSGWEGELVSGV